MDSGTPPSILSEGIFDDRPTGIENKHTIQQTKSPKELYEDYSDLAEDLSLVDIARGDLTPQKIEKGSPGDVTQTEVETEQSIEATIPLTPEQEIAQEIYDKASQIFIDGLMPTNLDFREEYENYGGSVQAALMKPETLDLQKGKQIPNMTKLREEMEKLFDREQAITQEDLETVVVAETSDPEMKKFMFWENGHRVARSKKSTNFKVIVIAQQQKQGNDHFSDKRYTQNPHPVYITMLVPEDVDLTKLYTESNDPNGLTRALMERATNGQISTEYDESRPTLIFDEPQRTILINDENRSNVTNPRNSTRRLQYNSGATEYVKQPTEIDGT